MKRSSFCDHFYIRESKVRKNGLVPIEVMTTINGERSYFNVGKQVLFENWDPVKQRVKGKDPDAKLINVFLSTFRATILEKESELLNAGFVITPDLLKKAYFNQIELLQEKTLMQVVIPFNNSKEPLVGKTVAKATFYSFKHSYDLLSEFILQKYKSKDLYLREINLTFVQNFHAFLVGSKGMRTNTAIKLLKFLKQMKNLAVANNYITYSPINLYKVEHEKVEIDFLNDEELQKIINFTSPYPRLEIARDTFLFGCFTGLSYIDIKTLGQEHFETDKSGRIWLKKNRIKTGVLSRIPLLPMAKMILDKYKGQEKLIPLQHTSDVNKYLKEIAMQCGIMKNVTFHTSRHTFATTETLSHNISMEVIAKMMGHTNTRMTSHYAKLLDKCIAEEMDKLEDLF